MFYGQLVQETDRLATLRHPLYGTFVEQKGEIPSDAVERLVAALGTARIKNGVG